MKFYHVAPEKEAVDIINKGIYPNDKGEITIIVLKDNFLMNKYIFDVYAWEVLKVDIYCALRSSSRESKGTFLPAVSPVYYRQFIKW